MHIACAHRGDKLGVGGRGIDLDVERVDQKRQHGLGMVAVVWTKRGQEPASPVFTLDEFSIGAKISHNVLNNLVCHLKKDSKKKIPRKRRCNNKKT